MKSTLYFHGRSYRLFHREELYHTLTSRHAPTDFVSFLRDWLTEKTFHELITSGTTGEPKSIRVQSDDFRRSAKMTLGFLGLKPGQTMLHCLPCKYIAGKMMIVRGLEAGMDMLLVEPKADPLAGIETPVDFTAITPHQLASILKNETSAKKLQEIGTVIIGGGAPDFDSAQKITGFDNKIFVTYGMTETISHVAMKRVSGSAGNEPYRLVSPEFEISTDDRNCLILKTPYKHMPEVVTNDVVDQVGADRFHWLGRYDDVINSGGIKIIPGKLEVILSAVFPFPFFIAGISDPDLGEAVALIVEGPVLSPPEFEPYRQQMKKIIDETYHRPHKIGFADKFIRTETGKVMRKASIDLIEKFYDL